jgi:hypothetical protein
MHSSLYITMSSSLISLMFLFVYWERQQTVCFEAVSSFLTDIAIDESPVSVAALIGILYC